MIYKIEFHEHVSQKRREQFLMRLNEIGIDINQTAERKYELTTTREGKLERVRFFLFKSTYTRLFNVIIDDALQNDSDQREAE